MVFIGVMLFGFVYNTIAVYILMIIISFVVRLLTALFMRAYIQMHPTVSKQLTIAAMFLPATIYMVIGVLGNRRRSRNVYVSIGYIDFQLAPWNARIHRSAK